MTPSCPVFLGLGDASSVYPLSIPVPSWWLTAGHQWGWAAASALSSVWDLPLGGGSASRQEKVIKPNFPAQLQKAEFLHLFPGCVESLSDIFVLFLSLGECLKLQGLK